MCRSTTPARSVVPARATSSSSVPPPLTAAGPEAAAVAARGVATPSKPRLLRFPPLPPPSPPSPEELQQKEHRRAANQRKQRRRKERLLEDEEDKQAWAMWHLAIKQGNKQAARRRHRARRQEAARHARLQEADKLAMRAAARLQKVARNTQRGVAASSDGIGSDWSWLRAGTDDAPSLSSRVQRRRH